VPTELLVNAYYLQEEATRALRAGRPPRVVDEVLGKAAALGATLVRTAAYNADPCKRGDSAIRLDATTTDPIAWAGLDLVIARAHAHGLRLLLVLGNQWDDLGGARAYVAWSGLRAPRRADGRFFTAEEVIALYASHVVETLTRRSSSEGTRYADHPAIAGWELLNEPRGEGLDRAGDAVRAWIDRLGAVVRRAAGSSQWVISGEEGLDVASARRDRTFWDRAGAGWILRARTSFSLNVRSPHLDAASLHLYPEAWGVRPELVREAGERMLRESAAIARAAGKRLVVGEMGVRSAGTLPLGAQRAIVARWLRVAEDEGALAVGPWMLAHDDRPHRWDHYHHYVRDGLALDHPDNGISPVLRDFARRALDARADAPRTRR
jgi:mannan endo-1,4-beta-mannosidase